MVLPGWQCAAVSPGEPAPGSALAPAAPLVPVTPPRPALLVPALAPAPELSPVLAALTPPAPLLELPPLPVVSPPPCARLTPPEFPQPWRHTTEATKANQRAQFPLDFIDPSLSPYRQVIVGWRQARSAPKAASQLEPECSAKPAKVRGVQQCRSFNGPEAFAVSGFSWIGAPSVRRRGAAGRPRAPRCGRPATQALACGQRGAPTAEGGIDRPREHARRRVQRLSRERAAKRRGQARYDVGTSSVARDGGWFWSRSRGNVWVTGEAWAAACAYEFVESALACRRGARAERGAAPLRVSRSASNSTNSSAFFLLASLRLPNLFDREPGGEGSVNARSRKICARGCLVWAGANDQDPSQRKADF